MRKAISMPRGRTALGVPVVADGRGENLSVSVRHVAGRGRSADVVDQGLQVEAFKMRLDLGTGGEWRLGGLRLLLAPSAAREPTGGGQPQGCDNDTHFEPDALHRIVRSI